MNGISSGFRGSFVKRGSLALAVLWRAVGGAPWPEEERMELLAGREGLPVSVGFPGGLTNPGGGKPGKGWARTWAVPLPLGVVICSSLSGRATETIKAGPKPTELFLKRPQSHVKLAHPPPDPCRSPPRVESEPLYESRASPSFSFVLLAVPRSGGIWTKPVEPFSC